MYEKSGKFYSDWRDRKGCRHRKSFTSARAALKHEAEQRELAHPKQTAAGRRLLHSSSLKLGKQAQEISYIKPQSESSRKSALRNPTKLKHQTLSKLTKRSTEKVTPIRH
jgi:hypothetical protein